MPEKTRDHARIGRRSKRKGARFELEIADELRVVWPMARRGIGQARFGGEVPDVDCTPFWVECKHRAHPNVPAALAQATEAAASQKSTKPPLAVTRANGGPIVVSLYLADFLKFAERIERAEKQDCERAGVVLASMVGAPTPAVETLRHISQQAELAAAEAAQLKGLPASFAHDLAGLTVALDALKASLAGGKNG